jgi:O-methyltransferase involved in polyketide biosynthesis
VKIDLTDDDARQSLFQRLGAEGLRVLVVTEGLLIYLTADQVGELAADLHAVPSFNWWLFDLASPRLLKIMGRSWNDALKRANAPFQFAPAEGPEFFRTFGWREAQSRFAMPEARRLNREMRGMWFWRFLMRFYPQRIREEFKRMNAFVVLERT